MLSNSCWYLLGIVKSRLALKDQIAIDYLGGNPGLVGFQPLLYFLRQLEITNQIEHGFIQIRRDAIEGRLVAVEDRHDIPTIGLDSAHRVLLEFSNRGHNMGVSLPCDDSLKRFAIRDRIDDVCPPWRHKES